MIKANEFDNFNLLRHITGGLAAYAPEDKLLYDVLRKHLGREPQVGDLGRCAMASLPDHPDEYFFRHANTVLGKVKRDIRLVFNYEMGSIKMVYEVSFFPTI